MIRCRVSYTFGTNSWGTHEHPTMKSFSSGYIFEHSGRDIPDIPGLPAFAPSYLVDVEATTYGNALLHARELLGDKVFPYPSSAYRIINEDQPEQTLWWVHPLNKHAFEPILEVRPCWWHDNDCTYMVDIITSDHAYALDYAVGEVGKYKSIYGKIERGLRDILIKKEK